MLFSPFTRSFIKTFRPFLAVLSETYFCFIEFIFAFINFFIPRKSVYKPIDGHLLISATNAAEMIRKRQVWGAFF